MIVTAFLQALAATGYIVTGQLWTAMAQLLICAFICALEIKRQRP